ncbi:MAG: hypothetical protein BGO26_18290 [Actinobacteria bacterium 69-20]|nr:sugar ABC transporter ATP-binding protein [Actinomycetota bacterium]OJV24534.1 MAG: hypothetical protein BGO26_18290 [Actinobacteria bacterium 69-20]
MRDALMANAVTVVYPGNRALDDVTVALEPGRVHVLAGQNGAGKSTLIKVLTGAVAPHAGSVTIGGRTLQLRQPADARRAGIRVVPQELQLFPSLRVWENITAGDLRARSLGTISRGDLIKKAQHALRMLHSDIDPYRRVADLTPAQQQSVAICQALAEDARFLIFDEPTAALARGERADLLRVIGSIAAAGVGVLFVSHHLEESLAIGDDVSVLRDGKLVWTRARSDVTADSLTGAMFGEMVNDARIRTPGPRSQQAPILELEDLRWITGHIDGQIQVCPGDIVGIAGLPGSGANTLNRSLAKASPSAGRITLSGRAVGRTASRAIRAGFGIIPSDRKSEGLFPYLSVTNNICSSTFRRFATLGYLNGRAMRRTARGVADGVSLTPPDTSLAISTFSGGNQQKALVGRWLIGNTRVILADEPTRGVDIHSRAQIHDIIRKYASDGHACLVYSSDLQELAALATRILVLRRDGSHELIDTSPSPEELYRLMSQTGTPTNSGEIENGD